MTVQERAGYAVASPCGIGLAALSHCSPFSSPPHPRPCLPASVLVQTLDLSTPKTFHLVVTGLTSPVPSVPASVSTSVAPTSPALPAGTPGRTLREGGRAGEPVGCTSSSATPTVIFPRPTASSPIPIHPGVTGGSGRGREGGGGHGGTGGGLSHGMIVEENGRSRREGGEREWEREAPTSAPTSAPSSVERDVVDSPRAVRGGSINIPSGEGSLLSPPASLPASVPPSVDGGFVPAPGETREQEKAWLAQHQLQQLFFYQQQQYILSYQYHCALQQLHHWYAQQMVEGGRVGGAEDGERRFMGAPPPGTWNAFVEDHAERQHAQAAGVAPMPAGREQVGQAEQVAPPRPAGGPQALHAGPWYQEPRPQLLEVGRCDWHRCLCL